MAATSQETQPLYIGPVRLPNRVLLAPMSGISDLPFRALAHRLGAGLVVSEMIASEALVKDSGKVAPRLERAGGGPFAVQLAGREARWMGEAARIAADRGADIIDINMGCPAKKVTNGQSGSALMRDADHALSLIEAVVAAVDVPVTLKMRMGWDHDSLNAPELARRAEQAGVRMITVHGRTRCQFFDGEADWPFIARVKAAVSVPVIANGDARSVADVTDMLAASGADGAMIGRGACGQPWLPGRAAAALDTGRDSGNPPLARQSTLVREHYGAMLAHYGREAGVRNARKHLGWYLEGVLGPSAGSLKSWRRKLCREDDPHAVHGHLAAFYDSQMQEAA